MNRYISMLLSMILVLALLTGCNSEVPGGSLSTLETEPPTAAQTETQGAAQEETVEDTAPAENESYLGRMEGGIYENTYTGYGCKLDTNWTFATAEQLQELPDNVAELFKDTELEEATQKYTQITDMLAENANDLTSINVLYQKLDAATRLAFLGMSSEEIADALLADIETYKTAYADAGIDMQSMEKVQVTFLGKEHTALFMTSTFQGIPYYTLQIQDYSLGQYGVTLTLASFQENKTESLLELFYAL